MARYYDDELYHHGIKGQRWGIRRFQNPDGTLTAAGKKKKAREYTKELNAWEEKSAKIHSDLYTAREDIQGSLEAYRKASNKTIAAREYYDKTGKGARALTKAEKKEDKALDKLEWHAELHEHLLKTQEEHKRKGHELTNKLFNDPSFNENFLVTTKRSSYYKNYGTDKEFTKVHGKQQVGGYERGRVYTEYDRSKVRVKNNRNLKKYKDPKHYQRKGHELVRVTEEIYYM